MSDTLQSRAIDSIIKAIDDWRNKMTNHRTGNFSIHYQRMIEIFRAIRLVRIGDWALYLQCLCDMHPYFAAAGHNNFFILKMLDLERKHPDVYEKFSRGLFLLRIEPREFGLAYLLISSLNKCL